MNEKILYLSLQITFNFRSKYMTFYKTDWNGEEIDKKGLQRCPLRALCSQMCSILSEICMTQWGYPGFLEDIFENFM